MFCLESESGAVEDGEELLFLGALPVAVSEFNAFPRVVGHGIKPEFAGIAVPGVVDGKVCLELWAFYDGWELIHVADEDYADAAKWRSGTWAVLAETAFDSGHHVCADHGYFVNDQGVEFIEFSGFVGAWIVFGENWLFIGIELEE